MKFTNFQPVIIIVLTFFVSTNGLAQSFYQSDTVDHYALEYYKPNYENSGDDIQFFTGSYHFTFAQYISDQVMMTGHFPVSVSKSNLYENQTSFGNIYLGTRLQTKNRKFHLETGLQLPSAGDEDPSAFWFGYVSDAQRIESYFPKSWGFKAKLGFESDLSNSGVFCRLKTGWVIFRETKFDEDRSFLDYQALLGYAASDAKIYLLASGRHALNENAKFGEDKAVYSWSFGTSYRLGIIEPGFAYRKWISDFYPEDTEASLFFDRTLMFNLVFHVQ